MKYDQEYYVLDVDTTKDFPQLSWDSEKIDQIDEDYDYGVLDRLSPVQLSAPILLTLGDPLPLKPQLADAHSLPPPVLSKRIAEALKEQDLYGVQLLPVEVDGLGKLKFEDYSLLHVFQTISCLDLKRADYTHLSHASYFVDRLALSESILDEIDLKFRRIFLLEESTSFMLVHQELKDFIESLAPVGLRFFRVDEWTPGSSFKP